jgi:DHA2 family multidrug resistance protein-like MFS transporter
LATQDPIAEGVPKPRRFLAIVAVSLGSILTTIDGPIVNVALPTLSRDLHVTPSATVLVVTIYQLVLMMTVLPFSALGDRLGHRNTYQLGQLIFVVATLLCFFAESLPFLVLVRGFQALGAAMVMSVSSAMVRAIYPKAQLGRGLAFNTVVAASGASFAPTLGGMILAVAPWPWLFAMVIPFGVLSILIGRSALPESARHSDPYDVLGAVLCASTFGLTVAGLESGVQGDSPIISAALVALGLGVGTYFVRRELRQARPMLPVDLLARRAIGLPAIGSLCGYLAMTMVMVTLPFRLQQVYHFTPPAAGAMLAPLAMMALFFAPAAGMLSDRYPAGALGGIGMTIAIAGMVCVGFLPADPHSIDILWRVALIGIGFGLFFSPNARQIIGAVPVARAATAGGLVTTVRGAGQTLGATTVAALLSFGVGTGPVPGLVGAGLCFIAGLCSLAVLRTLRRTDPAELPDI